MKKWTYHQTFLLLIGVFGLFPLFAGLLSLSGTTLYFGFVSLEILTFFVCCLIFALAVSWLAIWILHRISQRRQKVLTVILLSIVLLALSFFSLVESVFTSPVYCSYISDDGNHTIIVEYEEFLFSSWGNVYELTSPVTMKLLGSYSLDDVYPSENFTVYWHSDSFEIDFGPESHSYEYLKGD